MKYSGAYALVLVLHLLTVAFLVGPAAVAGVLSSRYVRARRPEALREAARTTRLLTLASLLTVLLGSWLVSISGGSSGTAQWSMGQLWVIASYALWVVAALLVLILVVPAQEGAATALERDGNASAFVGRMAAGAGIAMLCYLAILVLMVLKPGA